MKKLFLLLAVLMLVMPTSILGAQDAVVAVDEAVAARLAEYNSALPQGFGVTSIDDFNVMLIERDVVLLDVREVAEYEAGHLEGSFNVPIRELAQNLDLLPDLNADIMVICKGGGRAMLAMTALQLLGYENARMLRGGYDAWVGEELPTTTEPFVPEAGVAPEVDPAVLAAVDNYLSNLPAGFGMVGAQDLAVELVDAPPLLIDVRSEEEWNTNGYIEGAQLIPINEFMARQAEWPQDKDAKIVIYCASSFRGAIATVMMNLMGYTNVRNLSGGMNAWVAAGQPVVGAAPAEPETTEAVSLEETLAAYVASLPDTFGAVRPADLATELASDNAPFLVDVRTVDEYVEAHIEGAINIPLNELTANLDKLPAQDANLVIVCGSGHRSAMSMAALNLLGWTNARSLMGGTGAWGAAELPLTDVPTEAVAGTAPEVDPALFEVVNAFITNIPAGYYTVRPADLGVELIENAPTLIDVRTQGEWDGGRIEGATFITFRDLMTAKDQWPTDLTAPIVVYDNPTHRSSIAMTLMRLLGYENVRALAGGTGAWTKAELPLVTE